MKSTCSYRSLRRTWWFGHRYLYWFQALVKLRLLPYAVTLKAAKVNESNPLLHDAKSNTWQMVKHLIANTNSPWLAGVLVTSMPYPSITRWKVNLSWQLRNLWVSGQWSIPTNMLTSKVKPSMDSKYNPNGSVNGLKVSLSVKNGQIIGKMGHSERFEDGLFQNIPGNKINIFASAVQYFFTNKNKRYTKWHTKLNLLMNVVFLGSGDT